VNQVGAQATNIARNAVLSSSLPETLRDTVDRQCGCRSRRCTSPQAVMSGVHERGDRRRLE